MIGMVLVSHGRLAEELRAAMEHVVGPQRGIATVCIGADDDVEARRADIAGALADVDCGDGAVILTDMFGGTPSNLAISLMAPDRVEVIAGVNLPMLVKLAKTRSHHTLAECVDCAEAAGRKYIGVVSHMLAAGTMANMCRAGDPCQGMGAGMGQGIGAGMVAGIDQVEPMAPLAAIPLVSATATPVAA